MKILFGVFDLGLGHATRCTPLIDSILRKGHKVEIISTGRALTLLKKNFGNKCKYYDVPDLSYLYAYKKFFKINYVLSIPKTLKRLKESRKICEEIIRKGNYDKVISDSRVDVYDNAENSYLINHQLRFHAPKIVERAIELFLSSTFKNYKYILVPDFNKPNLTGKLSHNLRYVPHEKIKYLGIISHIRKLKIKKDIDYFISLSGPQIPKENLQKKIMEQIKDLKGHIVIAGGNPEEKNMKKIRGLEFHNFLNKKEQEKMMNKAKFVIIRAGYTTIMELAELDKTKALLIPCPGQTEQEYLVRYYSSNNIFHYTNQSKLNLKKDIKQAKNLNGFKSPWKTKESIRKFLEVIKIK